MHFVCLDLEGVLVPEIWVDFAELTGIDELRATTRDVPDYDELMRRRLELLDAHGLGLPDIEQVVARLSPLEGAREFLDGLRSCYQVVILSDTFYEFVRPLMAQLGWPTLFCHSLAVDDHGRITDYLIRLADHKRRTVEVLRGLNLRIAAVGDSYNDVGMLEAADVGVLFRPPENVVAEYPQYRVTQGYGELRKALDDALATV